MSYYPGQGYNGGGGGGYGYGPPPGHPPPQQYYSGPPPQQQRSYGPPSGPPQHHHYGPPPGPPQNHYGPPQQHYGPPGGPPPPTNYGSVSRGSSQPPKRYPPPNYPPPPHLDAYGYPLPQGRHHHAQHARAGPPPPDVPQQFGHGAPEGYTFQYSKCTGRRKALLIGINYFGQQGELRGCINDVHNISAFLVERYNYKREDMIILTDDQQDPIMIPTRENIIRAFGWLIQNAQPNDALFLHYSGHGGRVEDLDGDEDDGYDECIYPVDHAQAGPIIDDEIHARVVKPLLQGVRLTAIFDSCHSATVMDLPYVYSTKGVLKEPNLAKEAATGLFDAFSAYSRGDLAGAASSVFALAKSAMTGDEVYEYNKQTRTSPADVVMFSGSKDDQTSADATIDSKATGAMSWAFISALKANPQQSYVELLNSVRDILEEKYTQKPQLSSSHPIDTDLLFVM
uniref:WGS project CBMI000000000 data, contig CS3069_c002267 n=1 Tax=Fusarium clavum TaxID=2594811 RepID=A0A090MCK4_9HYPO|nr:unnamed protein product [Fusarium clavum]